MSEYVKLISQRFQKEADPAIAAEQKAYMRNQFEYLGLKSPIRREIQRPFLNPKSLPAKQEVAEIVNYFWRQSEREFQYFGQELLSKYQKRFEREDINLLEFMVTHRSWWDTVDYIAANLIGAYFKSFPEERDNHIHKWLNSDNIWLKRCCLLFQLKYKKDLDTKMLVLCIDQLSYSQEFFIAKAIGWILSEYSKTNPVWVEAFVIHNNLQPLSKREALKFINKRKC